jgi:hypothetical protein
MRKPFPVLGRLSLCLEDAPFQLPNTFLGGSAPRLRELTLRHISFPTLPRLLLYSRDLSELHLHDIPFTGYILPEAIVTCASALTKLKSLTIEFKSPASTHGQTINNSFTSSTPAHVVFSSLTHFQFQGDGEYLDDLLARFYAPVIEVVNLTLFNELFFRSRQVDRFIASTPIGTSCNRAEIDFTGGEVEIRLLNASLTRFSFKILCTSEVQVSSMAQIFREVWLPLSHVESLDLCFEERSTWQTNKDPTAWEDIFHKFHAVHTLRIIGLHTPILSVLKRLDEESAGVLPRLQDLYLGGYEPSGPNTEPFITKRRHSKRPVTVHSRQGMTSPGAPATSSLHHARVAVPAGPSRIKDRK